MPGDEQTKQKALDLVLEIAEKQGAAIEDEQLRRVASAQLLSAVFELAWEHQWERTPASFVRAVRPLVNEAVSSVVIPDED